LCIVIKAELVPYKHKHNTIG